MIQVKIIGRLRCLLGRHERSRARAWNDGQDWISECRWCGLPMRKDFATGWAVEVPPPNRTDA